MTDESEAGSREDDKNALERLRTEGSEMVAELFTEHRERLARMVHFRLDSRLQGRVDIDDILQEAYLDATTRIPHFLKNPSVSPFIWLRTIVGQTLINVHRRHLGAQMRDAFRETTLQSSAFAPATSLSMASRFVSDLTSPSQAAIRAEVVIQLEEALEGLNSTDREILALRHFEDLGNSEVAEALGITEKAASIRYIRAIDRLKSILRLIPGFLDE